MKGVRFLSQRKLSIPLLAACALLQVLAAYGQATCPPPPFPPPPQTYHPVSGLAAGCPDGSIASIRSCSENDYNTNLSRFFGTLTFEKLDITGNGVGFNLWWISQGNGQYIAQGNRQADYSGCSQKPGRNLGAKRCPAQGGTVCNDPVNISTGNQFQAQSDYQVPGSFPLSFRRFYNSAGYGSGTIGARWTHSFERNIAPLTSTTVVLTRDDGEMVYFQQCASGWCGGLDSQGVLTSSTNGSGELIGWRVLRPLLSEA
jgi:hypothetical protein